jgi:hypothetical protein
MHRQFVDERLRRRLAKERGENPSTGSSLNKGKVKREMEASMDPSLFSTSSTWGAVGTDPSSSSASSGLPLSSAAQTKRIRIGASIDSADSSHAGAAGSHDEAKMKTSNALGSIAKNILEEDKAVKGAVAAATGKGGAGEDEEEYEEVEEGEGDEEEGALVYEYDAAGMDDYDDEGDDEYY